MRPKKAACQALCCFLARCQHHDHLTAFHFRHGFNLTDFDKIVAHTFENAHAQLLVGHFASAETQGDFCLVAFFKEAAQIAQLHLVIAFVCTRTEFDFLDLDDFLLGAGFVLALLFLVLEFAVIHQTSDGRLSIWRDLNEINVVLFCQIERFGGSYDPQLFSINANETYLRDTDFTIDAMRLFGCDV